MQKKKMHNKKAISLIVLVITIIVMIILAAAVIISLSNVNIFDKSEEAVDKYTQAQEKEKMQIAVLNASAMGGVNITNLTETINEEFNEDWEFFSKAEDCCVVKIKSSQERYEITTEGKLEDYQETEILADKSFFRYSDTTLIGLSEYGNETLTALAGKNVKLVIPEEFTAITRLYIDHKVTIDNIKNLTIYSPGVTSMRDSVFSCCKSLVSINAPNLTETGSSAFAWCSNLTNVYMPKLNIVKTSVFTDCKNLTNIDVSGATEIQYKAFPSCLSLSNINLPNVTTIGGSAFINCGLKNLNLPNATTIAGNAFESCTKLIEVDIPNVTTIGSRSFGWCSNLTSVNSPKLTTIYESAFRSCKKLSNIDLSKVTTINGDYTFTECNSLTSIDLSSIQTIGNQVFYFCNNLSTINYAGTIEEWKQVSIGSGNWGLSKAKIICSNGTIN